jgi:spore germination protein
MEIYVVQAGDTLISIAQKTGTTVQALEQLNQFPDPSRLVIGQAILIPGPSVTPLQYTVARDDTLYLIAQVYSTTVNAIVQANNITNPNLINVGTRLVIPGWSAVTYTVQSGDTLYKIANNFGISVNLIAKTNNILSPFLIYPGQILIIPRRIAVSPQKDIETLAYFQLYNLSGLERSLAQMGNYITYGAMFQYPVTPAGNIIISANTTRAVDILKRFNIRPFPVITNWTANVGFDSD